MLRSGVLELPPDTPSARDRLPSPPNMSQVRRTFEVRGEGATVPRGPQLEVGPQRRLLRTTPVHGRSMSDRRDSNVSSGGHGPTVLSPRSARATLWYDVPSCARVTHIDVISAGQSPKRLTHDLVVGARLTH